MLRLLLLLHLEVVEDLAQVVRRLLLDSARLGQIWSVDILELLLLVLWLLQWLRLVLLEQAFQLLCQRCLGQVKQGLLGMLLRELAPDLVVVGVG